MKLRNKIAKEIWNIPEWRTPAVQEGDISFFAELNGDGRLFSYKSIAELNAEWEDYKPAEPLIKDEKIRKAVRAWAEANEETELKATGGCLVTTFKGLNFQLEAKFRCRWTRDGVYTIAELCGEEEA